MLEDVRNYEIWKWNTKSAIVYLTNYTLDISERKGKQLINDKNCPYRLKVIPLKLFYNQTLFEIWYN